MKILVSLVIAGEILVSEEYGYIVRHFGFTEANSRFYYFHYEHDKSGSGSHWERFNSLISSSIVDEASLEVAIAAIKTAVNVRLSFFLQYLEP